MPSPLVCQVRRRLPVGVVSLFGTLDETSVVDAVVSLRDCLADQPTALVVDASHLAVSGLAALLPIAALGRDAKNWPGAEISVCSDSASVRSLVIAAAPDGELRTCTDAEETVVRWLELPVPPRVEANLMPGPDMPAATRQLVALACTQWGVPRIRRLAELVSSEMASNAVVHARTPVLVTVRLLAESCLQISVRDKDPRLVHHPPPGAHGAHHGEHGRGLLILDAMTDAWGSVPTGNGKVVWAHLRVPRPRSVPPL